MLNELCVSYSFHLIYVYTICLLWDFAIPVMPYGVRWREHRRPFQEYFHTNEVYKFIPIQRREVHTFLHRLLVTPDDFVHHIHQ